VSDFQIENEEETSGGAPPGHARVNALAEIHPHRLPPWQSKVEIIKLYIKILF